MHITQSLRWAAGAALCLAMLPSLAEGQGDRDIRRIRPLSQQGLNTFEDPKSDTTPYRGLRLAIGGGFAQEFQNLSHESGAEPNVVNGVNANELGAIGPGFNTAMANLYINVQMAPGIRVAMTSYLSSRNHNEAWVKDGYLLIDESPFDIAVLNRLMEVVTLKVGHFQINYGDAHFRRTDGGNSLYNPFVGNLALDAMTTEIGGEAYLRTGPWLAMVGITNSEIRGHTGPASARAPAYLAKLGFDKQLSPAVRARLTGSSYFTARSIKNTLYTGDRAGTHYFGVMEGSADNWSGNINPKFVSNVQAVMINPFLKVRDLELFGTAERATGGASTEPDRTWSQYAVDGVYRLFDDRLYAAARYNVAEGRLHDYATDVGVTRVQLGGGMFLTQNILAKLEYVQQRYQDFPTTDLRHDGVFKGVMIQGAVLF